MTIVGWVIAKVRSEFDDEPFYNLIGIELHGREYRTTKIMIFGKREWQSFYEVRQAKYAARPLIESDVRKVLVGRHKHFDLFDYWIDPAHEERIKLLCGAAAI